MSDLKPILTVDEKTGMMIRRTDNSPKDEDSFLLAHQVKRPLTEAEIDEVLKEAMANA